MNHHRNPTDLLGLGRDPALARLLRACGADEACITGGASDYDKFLALAEAMPLCEGHPLREAVNRSLQDATGLAVPLCPHTAHPHWDAWVETHWYGGGATSSAIPAVCPFCAATMPTVLREEDLTALPNPTAVKAPDLNAWSAALASALPVGETPALFTLPEDYAFTRPNPYHANLAVGKVYAGDELTGRERDLLLTQALRVWGQVGRGHILLRGGRPEAVVTLLAYLDASKALSTLTWIPDDPADAGDVSGLYARVGTGFICRGGNSESAEKAYAAFAPVGRAVILSD